MAQNNSGSVLVTGGTGFVGSHLVELLLRRGYEVACLVRDPSRLRWLNGLPVRTVRGDCSDSASLSRAVRGVSVVFHLAGLTKAKRTREYYEVNHLGTKNILDACGRHNSGLAKFILVSSLAAAGPSPDGRCITDRDAPRPVSDYGRSKLFAEEEALRYKDRFPVVILRPSAVYGPRDRDIYELFRWAARGVTLTIAGEERFINPCYVEDLAEAIFLAAKKETPSGSKYFVAEDKAYPWSEFRRLLLSTGGVKAKNLTIPYWLAYLIGAASELGGIITGRAALTNRQKVREAAQRYWVCDLGNIRNELGFTARHPLEEGLKRTWAWYREKGWL